MIRAVAEMETKRSPWADLRRPPILFEHAKFSQGMGKACRATNDVYDHSHPDISGGEPYGIFAKQYSRLTRAAMLDESSALQSASTAPSRSWASTTPPAASPMSRPSSTRC